MAVRELGPDENRTRTSVRVGDTVTIRLPEQRTSGFRWRPEVEEGVLALVDDRYERGSTLPGAPGVRVVSCQVLRAGPARIRLVSRRGRRSGEPAEEYVVDVDAESDPDD